MKYTTSNNAEEATVLIAMHMTSGEEAKYFATFPSNRRYGILMEVQKQNERVFNRLIKDIEITDLCKKIINVSQMTDLLNSWLQDENHAENEPIREDEVASFVEYQVRTLELNEIDGIVLTAFAEKQIHGVSGRFTVDETQSYIRWHKYSEAKGDGFHWDSRTNKRVPPHMIPRFSGCLVEQTNGKTTDEIVKNSIKLNYSPIGEIKMNPLFVEFTVHTESAPNKSQIILLGGIKFMCVKTIDVTTDSEREQGLSYLNVELQRL